MVVAVVLSMSVIPLLRDSQAAAYLGEHCAAGKGRGAASGQPQAADELSAQAAGWDPHRDPLAEARDQTVGTAPQPAAQMPMLTTTTSESTCDDQDTADDDKDGLNNYDECIYATDPDTADMDADGLNDGQEVNYLGTNPESPTPTAT